MDVQSFYKTPEWKSARAAYLSAAGYLCERCLKRGLISPATVVHHRIYMNDETIKDPALRTGWKNLEALCWSCHELEHKGKQRRYDVDADGHVVAKDPPRGSK